MPKKKQGLMWNQEQLKIALLLSQGSSHQDIANNSGYSLGAIKKVSSAINKGDKPPPLTDEVIANAPAAPAFGHGAGVKKYDPFGTLLVDAKGKKNGKGDKVILDKSKASAATIMRLTTGIINCPLTPILQIGKEVSVKEFNWRPDMPWENFLDTVVFYFFKDRGITIRAYVKEDEDGS